jgi:alpha-tubulin suppressor-like RCC1 family protein
MSNPNRLFAMNAMNVGGPLTNSDIVFLKNSGRYPAPSPAYFYVGNNLANQIVGMPAADIHPYVPASRGAPAAVRQVAAPNTTNSSYATFFLVLEDGSAYSWGNNTFGAQGPATASGQIPQLLSQGPYRKITTCGTISASIFLKENGELFSAGYNNVGQTGRGNGTSFAFGRIGVDLWKDVSACNEYCLAVRMDGTLWSWGANANGATGLGTASGSTMSPTQIGTDTDWAKVFAGRNGAFGIKTDGKLFGWGQNTNGCLGNGNAVQQNSPVRIGTRDGWVAAAKSVSHSAFVHSDGTLWTSGLATNYRRGIAGTGSVSSPVQLGTATNWNDCIVNAASIIAKTSAGGVWFCGSASDGQFSSDVPMTLLFRAAPSRIRLGSGAVAYMIAY